MTDIELTEGSYRCHDFGFDRYLELLRDEEAEAKRLAYEEKQQKAAQAVNASRTYRSKRQRSEDAARKSEMRRLESEIDAFQERIDVLTEQISSDEVCADYQLMNEKCTEIDDLKRKIDEYLERLIELEG